MRAYTHRIRLFRIYRFVASSGAAQPQSTAASGEIGLLFYFRKQFASVIKSFRATPAILRSQPDPCEREAALLSAGWFSFFRFSEPRNATTHRRGADGLHIWISNFPTHLARRARDERIRHGKLLSEIPATTRFQPRVYWPLDLARVAIFAQFDAEK